MQLIKDGKRIDGRDIDEVRPVRIEVGIISEADGSAYVEWGKNKILCGVYGPRECIPKHEASPYGAKIKVRYMMSPFASYEEHGRMGPNRRSTELSKVIRNVFENLIIKERFPNTQINIYIDVLQAEGGTRTASVTAAAAALINAGIPMKDIVAGIAVGKADDHILVDLGKEEDNYGQSDMPLAISRKDKKLYLIQMDGLLTKEEIEEGITKAEKAIEDIFEKQKDALRRFYEKSDEEEFRW